MGPTAVPEGMTQNCVRGGSGGGQDKALHWRAVGQAAQGSGPSGCGWCCVEPGAELGDPHGPFCDPTEVPDHAHTPLSPMQHILCCPGPGLYLLRKKHNANDFSREMLKQPQHASVFALVLGTAVLPTGLWFASVQSYSPQF